MGMGGKKGGMRTGEAAVHGHLYQVFKQMSWQLPFIALCHIPKLFQNAQTGF